MQQKFEVFGSISLAFDGVKRKFWPLAGWSFLPYIAVILVYALIGAVFGAVFYGFLLSLQNGLVGGNFNAFAGAGIGLIAFFILFFVFSVLFYSWYALYLARIGTQALMGEDLRPGDAFRCGINRMISLFLIQVVLIIALYAAGLLVGLLMASLASLGSVGFFLVLLVGVAAVVAYFYVALGLVALVPIMANEGLGFGALARSWEMARGNRWQLLGTILMWILILVGIYLGFFVFMFVVGGLASLASSALAAILTIPATVIFLLGVLTLMAVMGPSMYLGLLKAEQSSPA